jgi:acyl-coenzyme A synthetase/AMP-(fatty) acid ligase
VTGTLPLLRGHPPESLLQWGPSGSVQAGRFIGAVRALAARLPNRRHVINLCEDRYQFLLGFAAAVIAGQVTLMPPSRAPEALRRIRLQHPDSYCLAGDEPVPEGMDAVRLTAADEDAALEREIPAIPAAQAVAIIFTSGTTGESTSHVKTWAALCAGAEALGDAIGLGPPRLIVGTVPSQHMFGLETTVMLPLQTGCAAYRGRPLLPADVAAATQSAPCPAWLMTTPVQLNACARELQSASGLEGVISSTMALSPALAREVETRWRVPVHEIYGCTEIGMVALRRPAHGETWTLSADLAMWQEGGKTWVKGLRAGPAQPLSDHVSLHAPRQFTLHGRVSDLVKIAGKRTSIGMLNAELADIEGVEDGAFFLPGAAPGRERLVAFVVAPGLSARQIVAALRARIDPVFLPRPLYLVDTLPRDANGKLPRASLELLARRFAP